MKLFKDSRGFMWSFGFDMNQRKPNPRIIQWWDLGTGEWHASEGNLAGAITPDFDVQPEFVMEHNDKIIAYQPGLCMELTFVGYPLVWHLKVMRAHSDTAA